MICLLSAAWKFCALKVTFWPSSVTSPHFKASCTWLNCIYQTTTLPIPVQNFSFWFALQFSASQFRSMTTKKSSMQLQRCSQSHFPTAAASHGAGWTSDQTSKFDRFGIRNQYWHLLQSSSFISISSCYFDIVWNISVLNRIWLSCSF
jgi:hypothetical protein